MAKLMLVEDDNNLREIYEARLQAEGYTIVSARDGEEALVVAKAEKPDLIISDVMMPKISGFEMLDILRNTEGLKEVKVIMLTALGQSDDQQRASKLGADRYLVKSQVTLEDIVKVTHDLLNDTATSAAAPAAEPAPAVPAPEPVAATPPPVSAAEPADQPAVSDSPTPAVIPVASEPVTPADPVTPTPPTADPPAAQTEAQEEAAVEAKIENFVAGATEEPTVPDAPAAPPAEPPAAPAEPAVAETPAPATPPPANPTPDTPADSANTEEAHDKVMDEALQKLEDSAEKTASEAAPIEAPVEAPEVKPPAPASNDAAPDVPGKATSVPIAHKKIIEPIDSEPKKDIETLLALEEAKEAEKAEAVDTPPQAVVVDTSAPGTANPSAPAADDSVDPHSIAL